MQLTMTSNGSGTGGTMTSFFDVFFDLQISSDGTPSFAGFPGVLQALAPGYSSAAGQVHLLIQPH
jgi:hypothetical protein